MVRTAATSIKVGGKASKGGGGGSRAASHNTSSHSGGGKRTIGGNKPVARPIPKWQKPITTFFAGGDKIPPPKEIVFEEQVCEEEIITLEAPDWQTSVADFMVKDPKLPKDNTPTIVDQMETQNKLEKPASNPPEDNSKSQKPKMEEATAGPSCAVKPPQPDYCQRYEYDQYNDCMDNNNYMQNQNYLSNNASAVNDDDMETFPDDENKENNEYYMTDEYMNPPKKRKFEGYRYLENFELPNK